MQVVLASALFPPDTAPSAAYCKELAARLAASYSVTAIIYGDLPEAVEGARIVAVSKRRPALLRLMAFTFALLRALKGADVLYIENGASVELPALLATTLRRVPIIVHFGDAVARERAARSRLLSLAERMLVRRSRGTLEETPLPRPEILPLAPRPEAAFTAYERSWREHLAQLDSLFTYGR